MHLSLPQPLSRPLHRWAALGLDVIFPPACAGCGKPGHRICPACAQQVTPTPTTICERCGHLQPARVHECPACAAGLHAALTRVRAAGLYVEPLRGFIHLLKYEQRPDLAPDLARYLYACLAGPEWADLRPRFDAIAPVPLHAIRRAQRGYNQSELLALHLSLRSGIPLRADLLERVKFTQAQVGLTAVQRRANVADAFGVSAPCGGQAILLIDDVYTTGATLAACADALHQANAALVCGLTLAQPSFQQHSLNQLIPNKPSTNQPSTNQPNTSQGLAVP